MFIKIVAKLNSQNFIKSRHNIRDYTKNAQLKIIAQKYFPFDILLHPFHVKKYLIQIENTVTKVPQIVNQKLNNL